MQPGDRQTVIGRDRPKLNCVTIGDRGRIICQREGRNLEPGIAQCSGQRALPIKRHIANHLVTERETLRKALGG